MGENERETSVRLLETHRAQRDRDGEKETERQGERDRGDRKSETHQLLCL